uniref:Uncharacterized protein n=1 Tax=Trypanosoma congolense (strain IL3000) TaxID=1068625 RepID=G0UZ23_TRYCI|nr:conserved hypothetical protein [Trypanosoma congolense IL3000]
MVRNVEMKRRRYDSDSDEDDHKHVEEPLLRYACASGNEVLRAMGLSAEEAVSDEGTSVDGDSHAIGAEQASHSNQEQEPHRGVLDSCYRITPAEMRSAALEKDRDVPEYLKGLLSEELLQVYCTTVRYTESKRSVDDKLLAQYLPYDKLKVAPLVRVEERMWENSYGIKPGWRWDGVVRGVGNLA